VVVENGQLAADFKEFREALRELTKEYDEEVISHAIEEKELKASRSRLRIANDELHQVIERLEQKNDILNSTLTRAQAEGTRLVLENRELKAKIKDLSPLKQPLVCEDASWFNEKYDLNGQPW
jgi:predicted RNase H-like nuclease (RuvC/YqgF family)